MKTVFMMIIEPGGEDLTLCIRSNVSAMEETVGIHFNYIRAMRALRTKIMTEASMFQISGFT